MQCQPRITFSGNTMLTITTSRGYAARPKMPSGRATRRLVYCRGDAGVGRMYACVFRALFTKGTLMVSGNSSWHPRMRVDLVAAVRPSEL